MAKATQYASQKVVPVKGCTGIFRKGGTNVGPDGKGGTGGSYQVRWRHRGRLTQKSFKTLTEAKRFKGKVDAGEAQSTSHKPFKTYADEWVKSYTGRTSTGVSEETRAAYKDALDRYAKPFFGTQPLDSIGSKMIGEYITHLGEIERDGKRLTPNTIRKYMAPVKALFATAKADELILRNPTEGVRITIADTRPPKPKHLTPEQTKALLSKIPSAHADMVYVLATTGLRISELLNLRWEDITATTLTVTKSKTNAGLRTLPLTPETARRLTKRRSSTDYALDSDFVFPARNGVAMDDHNFRYKVFGKAARKVGLDWATPHKLRHGIGTLMNSQGQTPAQIAAYLGHADGGQLAMRTYVHSEVPAVDFADEALA